MIPRRDFLKFSIAAGTATALPALLPTALPVASAASETASNFTLWQIPLLQNNSQGNSYVFQMNNGKVVVMDGGVAPEAGYLRGFLAALGNEVEAWFVSHPHSDHIGSLNEILKKPDDLKIKSVYHSKYSPEFYGKIEPDCKNLTAEFYANLDKSDISVHDITELGTAVKIDQTTFKILDVKDESVTSNAYNNSCMVIRVEDSARSGVFLGDAGIEQGDRLLAGAFRKELDCDFLQLAHHGQRGVRKDFYRTIKFNTCLWPTPLWLYNNNAGQGYNTHSWETVEIRELMEELGIKKHFICWQGLSKVQ